ncbi:hypothetical protein IFM89_034184 [Coptis chinensis]|uniref:Uncharacterized protein n=1 Tax=Coptis chinensis TaxID=261450 RepID=A0A835H0N2_9MAGN|nr:hypothetical protein IFM89_034184 [Coptis chinensis]
MGSRMSGVIVSAPRNHSTVCDEAIGQSSKQGDGQSREQGEEENQNQGDGFAGSSKRPLGVEQDGSGFGFQQQHLSNNPTSSSGFLPPSLD